MLPADALLPGLAVLLNASLFALNVENWRVLQVARAELRESYGKSEAMVLWVSPAQWADARSRYWRGLLLGPFASFVGVLENVPSVVDSLAAHYPAPRAVARWLASFAFAGAGG